MEIHSLSTHNYRGGGEVFESTKHFRRTSEDFYAQNMLTPQEQYGDILLHWFFSVILFTSFTSFGFGCSSVHPWDSRSVLWTQTLPPPPPSAKCSVDNECIFLFGWTIPWMSLLQSEWRHSSIRISSFCPSDRVTSTGVPTHPETSCTHQSCGCPPVSTRRRKHRPCLQMLKFQVTDSQKKKKKKLLLLLLLPH